MDDDGDGEGAAVSAEGFGLEGPRGWAFRGVGVDARPGSLIAIEGPSGSGRTSLLLALTGRMRATEGTAAVGGLELPKRMAAVRRISALAHVPGVTDLDPALTVGEHLHERALLQRRFTGSVRTLLRPRRERVAEEKLRIDRALSAAGLDRAALPKGSRTAVRDLERLEALRLSVALALIGRPRLLGVDDTDLKLSDAERAEAWPLLASLAADGTTVLAVCSEAPEGAVVVSTGTVPGGDPADTTIETSETGGSGESREASEAGQAGQASEAGQAGEADGARASGDTYEADGARGSEDAREADAARRSEDAREADAARRSEDARESEDGDDEGKEAADALAETGRS